MNINFDDFEKCLLYVKECIGKEVVLTNEYLLTNIVINIRRLSLELEELEKIVLENYCEDVFSALILGANLEKMKRDIEQIRKDYLKK